MICDDIDTFLYIYILYSAIVVQREIKDIQFSEIPKVVVLDGVTTFIYNKYNTNVSGHNDTLNTRFKTILGLPHTCSMPVVKVIITTG